MISLSLLHSYTPANIFLIQGDADTFHEIEIDLKKTQTPFASYFFSQLSIDIAKEMRSTILEQGEGEFWMLVSFVFFTKDAGDVFLKLLEEPYSGMHIVLCTPYPYFVPDTIRSRVLFLKQEKMLLSEKDFFSLSQDQKYEYIKKHFASDSEDDASIRKIEVFAILDDYEKRLHVQNKISYAPIVYDAKKMIETSQLPPKQVLEYVVTMLG